MLTVSQAASPKPSGAERDRDVVGSLQKGLAMLDILAASPGGLTLTEAAERAGLTRAGARRLLMTLVVTGHALQDGRRFSLSPKLLTLARSWLQGASLWTYAEPIMRDVARSLGESCSAAVLSGHDVVYVARVPGPSILGVALHIGTRLPAYCTSMGRVLLAGMETQALDAFLDAAALVPRTAKTVADREALRQRILEAARDGYALVDEELELGLRSIAVPICDRSGRVIAAINVPTQAARVTVADMRKRFLPELRRARQAIEDFVALQ